MRAGLLRLAATVVTALGVAVGAAGLAAAAPVVVGHRGSSTATVPEETALAYAYGHRHGAAVLEGDVHWTTDGVMVMHHDFTLDRTTTCTGAIAGQSWSQLSRCRTDIGGQPLWRLTDLLGYAAEVGRPLSLEIKPTSLSAARTRQFYDAVKASPVRLTSFRSNRRPMLQVKALDAADPRHALQYSSIVPGGPVYPPARQLRSVGRWVELTKSAPATVVRRYQAAGLEVCLWTGRTTTDYAQMVAKAPDCIVVDDPRAYRAWLGTRTAHAGPDRG